MRLSSNLCSRIRSSSQLLSTLGSNTHSTPHIQLHARRRLDAWIRSYDARQRLACSTHVDRITVHYVGRLAPKSGAIPLQLTKGISTPMDCACHLSEVLAKQTALALVDGSPWDMHRQLVGACELDFIDFKDTRNDPTPANEAFWRSACFLLAAALETSFRPEHEVRLLNNLPVTPSSGGFVCDVTFTPTQIREPWIPAEQELRALSMEGQRLAASDLPFQPLDVRSDMIESLYADDPVRRDLILAQAVESSSQTEDNQSTVCLYRMGNFVEASVGGPLISSSQLIGRFAVTSFQPLGWLKTHTPDRPTPRIVYRVQGVAIPTCFLTHFTTFERLMQWSRQPNPTVPSKPDYVVEFS